MRYSKLRNSDSAYSTSSYIKIVNLLDKHHRWRDIQHYQCFIFPYYFYKPDKHTHTHNNRVLIIRHYQCYLLEYIHWTDRSPSLSVSSLEKCRMWRHKGSIVSNQSIGLFLGTRGTEWISVPLEKWHGST